MDAASNFSVSSSRRNSARQSWRRQLWVISAIAPLTLTSLAPLPAFAQRPSSEVGSLTQSQSSLSSADLSITEISTAEATAILNTAIVDATAALSPSEKQAFELLLQLELSDTDLKHLSEIDDASVKSNLLNDYPVSIHLKRDLSSSQLKFSPAVFAAARLAGHMRGILNALVIGNVIGAIRSAEFDFPAIASALAEGDTRAFGRLIAEALPGQRTFVSALTSGASFACNAATIDLTPGLCERFTSFTQRTLQRYQSQNGARRRAAAYRETSPVTGLEPIKQSFHTPDQPFSQQKP